MDTFFGLDRPAKVEDLVLLSTFNDPVTLSIAEELLTEGGIPFLKKERGAGGVVRMIVGFQTFCSDIFVLPDDLDKANEILLPLFESEPLTNDTDDVKEEV